MITEILEQQDTDITAAHNKFSLYPVKLTPLAVHDIYCHLKISNTVQNWEVVLFSCILVCQICAKLWHVKDPPPMN